MFRSYFAEYVFVLSNSDTTHIFCTLYRRKFPSNARYISIITLKCYATDCCFKTFSPYIFRFKLA